MELVEKHNLHTELIENGVGWNLIRFQVYRSQKKFTKEERSILQKFLLELRKDKTGLFSTFYISNGTIYVNTDIYYEKEGFFIHNGKKVFINSLESIFSAMKRIQEDIAQKIDELEEFKEKTDQEIKISASSTHSSPQEFAVSS